MNLIRRLQERLKPSKPVPPAPAAEAPNGTVASYTHARVATVGGDGGHSYTLLRDAGTLLLRVTSFGAEGSSDCLYRADEALQEALETYCRTNQMDRWNELKHYEVLDGVSIRGTLGPCVFTSDRMPENGTALLSGYAALMRAYITEERKIR